MKVSVVTPCFNAVRYLPDCVASVRAAFRGYDYEHVIADGGSTDGTVDFLRSQSDLKWESAPDNGMYDALNKAIARAEGDVIGHLNSDEQYNPAGLHAALQTFQDKAADAVMGPTVMLDGAGEFLQLFKQNIVPRVIDTHWHMPVQSCSLLYKKALWEREPYDTNFRLAADHVWFRHQMERGLKLVCVQEPIGIFLWHGANLSSTGEPEDALADVDKSTLSYKAAKHIYRFRKLLAGGYRAAPIQYFVMQSGRPVQVTIPRPTLKIRRDLRKVGRA